MSTQRRQVDCRRMMYRCQISEYWARSVAAFAVQSLFRFVSMFSPYSLLSVSGEQAEPVVVAIGTSAGVRIRVTDMSGFVGWAQASTVKGQGIVRNLVAVEAREKTHAEQ